MNYEIVKVEEKKVIGLALRTNNQNPQMPEQIGGLWENFFNQNLLQKLNCTAQILYGVYYNYETDFTGAYDILICCEGKETKNLPQGVVSAKIEAGTYARFVLEDSSPKGISDFWTKLWSMSLKRKYHTDFEQYIQQENGKRQVSVYIGLSQ